MAWTPAGGTHLLDEVRTEIERRVGLAQNERGALLAVVEVRVFENTSEAQVSVPSEALLRPDHDRDVIADVVRRAQEELGNWR
jgi:predicted AAA+ superfamily ATPase